MNAKHLIITILSLLCIPLSAQTPNPLIVEGLPEEPQEPQMSNPLVIEGKITISAEPRLLLIIESESGQRDLDTIHLEQDGSFHYVTHKVAFPQRTSLRNKDVQLNDFFIAPGYHLTITGDGTDFLTLLKSAKIEGAASNRYKLLHDSIMVARMDKTNWYELKGDSLLQYISGQKHLTDSLEKVVFDKRETTDPFLSHFGRMTYLNNQFLRLYFLLAGVSMQQLDEEKARAFAAEITDKTILSDPFKDEYMISDSYKDWFLTQYLAFSIDKDIQNDPSLKDRKYYRLEKINEVFKGKIREYMLFRQLDAMLGAPIRTIEQFDEYKPVFDHYISEFTNNDYRQSLMDTFLEKENRLQATRKGKTAPAFTLKDDKGETCSLDDFHGKVVYIDLWASWCGPCRQEVPALRKIYEKYKTDDRIAIIGIAVHDGYNRWKKALEEDNPEWLQLHDADGMVARAYEANAIPKYILIDKKGNIVDMNAPSPSKTEELENKLIEEMYKE